MTNKKLIKLCSLWLLLGIIFSLFSCGAVLATDDPVIDYFYAVPAVIKTGETITLTWKTTNVAKIEIRGIVSPQEDLPTTGTLEVWPLTTTSYILIAYGTNGILVSQSFTVNVDITGTVKINLFESNKTSVGLGETVLLSWKISNGKSVRILGIEKEDDVIRPLEGNLEVWPFKTTTYILEATGLNGEIATESITINVKETTHPEILSFVSNNYTISKGEMITLTWNTKNAVKCTLETSTGLSLKDRKPNGLISVTPNKTTTFTLIAIDASGNEKKKSLTITIK